MYPNDATAAFETWADPPGEGATWADLVAWQSGRCAVCGGGGRMVEDHDHKTGRSRGILCWSCNVSEGVITHPAWVRWREVNPATVFGVHRAYPGRTYAEDEWTEEDNRRAHLIVAAIPA